MDIVMSYILIPLVVGVVGQFVADGIKTHREGVRLILRERVIIGAIVAVIVGVGLLLWPPYKPSAVNWCIDANQAVRVTGRLTWSLLGTPVSDGEVQIKIFPLGQDSPISREKIARTTADGIFTVTFAPPLPSADRQYLINTAYKREILGLMERWEIEDFRMGDLSRCPVP